MEHQREPEQDVLSAWTGRQAAPRAPRKRTGQGPAARVAVVLLALSLGLGTAGCLFSPRSDDGPPEGDEIEWVPPTDTGKVLQNLAAALAGHGSSNYLDCLTDDFRFFVDPQDSLDAGQEAEQLYANWDKSVEDVTINRIFTDSAPGITVTFANVDQPNENDDETYRREDYELTIVWQSGPHQPGEAVTYRGRATFWMRRDETERWAIFRWVDRRSADPGGSDTWGVLRGEYRN